MRAMDLNKRQQTITARYQHRKHTLQQMTCWLYVKQKQNKKIRARAIHIGCERFSAGESNTREVADLYRATNYD